MTSQTNNPVQNTGIAHAAHQMDLSPDTLFRLMRRGIHPEVSQLGDHVAWETIMMNIDLEYCEPHSGILGERSYEY